MTKEERIEKAVNFFKEGYNCSQSVVAAYADLYGFTHEQALHMAASFGGGIGRMRETCGAACGMFLLAGLERCALEGADRGAKAANIGVLATGYNVVDLDVARQRGIVVTNIPAYSTQSVAQMAIAHLLNITQRVAHYAHEVHNGVWSCTARFLLLEYTIDRTGRKENRNCWFWKCRSGYGANS